MEESNSVGYLIHITDTWEPEERISTLHGRLVSKYASQIQEKHGAIKVKVKEADDDGGGIDSKKCPGDVSKFSQYPIDQYDNVKEWTSKLVAIHTKTNIFGDTDDEDTDPNDEPSYTCEYCEENFTVTKDFVSHMRTHVNDDETSHMKKKGYVCELCSRQFKSRSGLDYHLKAHEGQTYSCPLCPGKKFDSKQGLNEHIQAYNHNDNNEETLYTCQLCPNLKFASKQSLYGHMQTHQTSKTGYKCTYCERQFRARSKFIVHLRSHTGDQPYKCDHCLKRFTQTSTLNRHLRAHMDPHKPPFTCKFCLKDFLRKSNLKIHMQGHTGGKNYTCAICRQEFAQECGLDCHMRTHYIARCEFCWREFASKQGLDYHLRTQHSIQV